MNQCKDCQFYTPLTLRDTTHGNCSKLTEWITHNPNEVCPECDECFRTEPNAKLQVLAKFSCAYFTQKHEVVDSDAIASALEPCIFCQQLPNERVQWTQIDPDIPYNDELGEPNTKALYIVMCGNAECIQHPSVYRDTRLEAHQCWNEKTRSWLQ